GGKNSLNRLIRCVCGKKIGPDPRNFNQRVSLGRNDLLIRTFPSLSKKNSGTFPPIRPMTLPSEKILILEIRLSLIISSTHPHKKYIFSFLIPITISA
ncbi:hypothetical protein, partial [Enterobacter kobei]|uniref:hypothetical protein n=1 Tax=Enterobacter kobei TaxID=208224 RepID=UPI00292D2E28